MRTIALVVALVGCSKDGEETSAPTPEVVQWEPAFDTSGMGAMSGVWGTGPDDVFVVGGSDGKGEVHHFDGSGWTPMTVPAEADLVVWAYGFAPDDVFAVGVKGTAMHYDGAAWTMLDSGTTEDLWGVFGFANDDVWVVGGNWGEDVPVMLHWDGAAFTPYTLDPAQNDRGATSIFKVWGIGSKLFAVGEKGLIVQLVDGDWQQVSGGAEANDDFVSLWGTSEDHIVAVGGRSGARIAEYDGTSWNTVAPSGMGGLSAVFMDDPTQAVIGGIYGMTATYFPDDDSVVEDPVVTDFDVHAIWGDGAGTYYGVGGQFFDPYAGVVLVRTGGS
jgi:hypothetical protein